jgi:hypothetical protein
VVEQVEKYENSIAVKGGGVRRCASLLKEGDIARTLLKDPQIMSSYAELILTC